jgi:hypothetical protein
VSRDRIRGVALLLVAVATAGLCAVLASADETKPAAPPPPSTSANPTASATPEKPAAPKPVRRQGASKPIARKAGTEQDAGQPESPTPPSITSVYPSIGVAGAANRVTLTGTQFNKGTISVHFGPAGVSGDCTGVNILSDSLLECDLPAGVLAGEVQHFVVIVAHDAGAVSSSVSDAGFVELPDPAISEQPSPRGDQSPFVQMHIRGTNFGGPGDPPPTVTYGPSKDDQSHVCDDTMLLSSGELICYVPRPIYEALGTPEFKVSRPSRYDGPGAPAAPAAPAKPAAPARPVARGH